MEFHAPKFDKQQNVEVRPIADVNDLVLVVGQSELQPGLSPRGNVNRTNGDC